MDFYRDISYYYDYIFPFKKVTYDFLLESFKLITNTSNRKNKILDLACGSGSYAIALASHSDKVLATDLDPLMIQQALSKNTKANIEFKVSNMLDIGLLNEDKQGFDLIYCIGNSVVHLDNLAEITSFIKSVYRELNKGGIFVVQIINFDRILKNQVVELPTIFNKEAGVTFIRNYIHLAEEHKIEFSTILDIKTDKTSEKYTQSVKLYPLKVDELFNAFELAGFENIELFGGFNNEKYNKETSYPLIIRANK